MKKKSVTRENSGLVLVPLSGIAVNPAENGEISAPESFSLLSCGEIETRDYGRFQADEEAFALIIASQNDIGNDLVIDYEHATLTGKEAPAAGWIKRLVNKGQAGLWVEVEWTQKAKDYLAAREYRYFSPVVLKRASDNRTVAIHSVALTNSPNIKHLEPLVNKAQASFLTPDKTEENVMLKKLIEMLKLKAEATEAEVTDAVSALVTKIAEGPDEKVPGDVLETLGLKADATVPEVKGTILALKSGSENAGDMATRVADLEQKLSGREADDLVTLALKAGKITPAQKPWAEGYAKSDAPGFKAYIEAATVVVPLKKLPDGGAETIADELASPEMKTLASVFDHSEESLKAAMA